MYLINCTRNHKAPIVATTAEQVRSHVDRWRKASDVVAFVPTMGNLHQGHLKLVEEAFKFADRVIVSIYVNPTQFGENEDFSTYPRTFDEDMAELAQLGVDMIFAPDNEEMYPGSVKVSSSITVPELSDILEGEFRPGFFTGVATVVNKLFNIVRPDIAVFGEKDYQQLQVIKRMVADLVLPVKIHPVATVRENNGLAMSSRNGYLSGEERRRASDIYSALAQLVEAVQSGTSVDIAEAEAREQLAAKGFEVDYVSVRQQGSLKQAGSGDERLVALAAARIGGTRLIDNIQF